MSTIRLPIDTKSLHYNIKNDNKIGHTATVATPLKQGNSYNKELGRIFEIPHYNDFDTNINLLKSVIKNARTAIKITDVFIFDKFAVNGIPIECAKQFCIYVREEIDSSKAQYGRIKVHYPMSFQFEDDQLDINNHIVLNAISEKLHNFAFFVTAFEYDTESKILNFRASIVGEPQVPYSKVFINEKGKGNKFVLSFTDIADHYDSEVIALRKNYNGEISPLNYIEIMDQYRMLAMSLTEILLNDTEGVTLVKNIGSEFPYAPYDFEYIQNNITKYAEVFYTATSKDYFSMSSKRVRFCNEFADNVSLLLYTDIAKNPQIHIFCMQEVNQFNKEIASIVYTRDDS